MIIIGEKINGAIPSTGKAILEKNEAFIRDSAIKQVAVPDKIYRCPCICNSILYNNCGWK